jgi:hypothetical protein
MSLDPAAIRDALLPVPMGATGGKYGIGALVAIVVSQMQRGASTPSAGP